MAEQNQASSQAQHAGPPHDSKRAIHRVCTQCNHMFRVSPEKFEAKLCSNCHKG